MDESTTVTNSVQTQYIIVPQTYDDSEVIQAINDLQSAVVSVALDKSETINQTNQEILTVNIIAVGVVLIASILISFFKGFKIQ